MLEERWVRMGEEAYTNERSLVGDLDKLNTGDHEAFVPAGSGKDAGDLLKLLERIREEEPEEPLWKGVKEMRPEAHGVHVSFEPGIDPPLYETDGARAACLLYKPE